MKIATKYAIGDTVYMRLTQEKFAGLIVSILIEPNCSISYRVAWENRIQSYHYEIELTSTYIPDFERDHESGEVTP